MSNLKSKKMKQIRLLLGLTIVFAMIGFTSCSDDEDSTGGDGSTPDLSPSISFLGGAEYTSSDVTVGLGDTIKVGIQANANATSGEKLSNFRATRDNGAEVIIDSSFKESSFTLDLTIIADTTARSE